MLYKIKFNDRLMAIHLEEINSIYKEYALRLEVEFKYTNEITTLFYLSEEDLQKSFDDLILTANLNRE